MASVHFLAAEAQEPGTLHEWRLDTGHCGLLSTHPTRNVPDRCLEAIVHRGGLSVGRLGGHLFRSKRSLRMIDRNKYGTINDSNIPT